MKRIFISICVSLIIYCCNCYLRSDNQLPEVESITTATTLKKDLVPGIIPNREKGQLKDSNRNYHDKIESLLTNIGNLLQDK